MLTYYFFNSYNSFNYENEQYNKVNKCSLLVIAAYSELGLIVRCNPACRVNLNHN